MSVRSTSTPDAPVVVIGGGPAGLTAAFALSGQGRDVIVFEEQSRVGGLAQTAEHNGFRFDIGGHRFFTKSRVIQDLWRDILGPDFLQRPRLSRIYYDGKFFQYPLRPLNVVGNLGIWTSAAVLASYVAARVADCRRTKLCRLGDEPVRPAAVSDVLQGLHREGVGHSLRADLF